MKYDFQISMNFFAPEFINKYCKSFLLTVLLYPFLDSVSWLEVSVKICEDSDMPISYGPYGFLWGNIGFQHYGITSIFVWANGFWVSCSMDSVTVLLWSESNSKSK
jgi:hypothetical protein